MVHKRILKQSNYEFKADKNSAQILIKIADPSITLEEARKIIEDSGVHIIKIRTLPSNCTLLKLNVRDMREIALKLTERGFSINGINAITL